MQGHAREVLHDQVPDMWGVNRKVLLLKGGVMNNTRKAGESLNDRESRCHVCKEVVIGEDYGDHPQWLTYDCLCGHMWSELNGEAVNVQRLKYKEFINDTL